MGRGRVSACVATALAAVLCWAAPPAELGAFLPLTPKPSGGTGLPTRLRGSHKLMLYAPAQGAAMALRVELGQVGRYDGEVLAHPSHDPATRLILRPARIGGPASAICVHLDKAMQGRIEPRHPGETGFDHLARCRGAGSNRRHGVGECRARPVGHLPPPAAVSSSATWKSKGSTSNSTRC